MQRATRSPAARLLRIFVCALLVASVVPVVTAHAVGTTYYVNVATGHDANGGGEADPVKSITAASQLAGSGDTIIVAAGAYSSSVATSSGEEFPIWLTPGVTLQADEDAEVVVDPELEDTAFRIGFEAGQLASQAIIEDDPVTIEGLTITHGRGEFGGGISVSGASAIVKDCLFFENSAGAGAGIAAEFSQVQVVDCTFDTNGWDITSGDYLPAEDEIPEPPYWMSETFQGGGIGAFVSEIDVTGCSFTGNGAIRSGAGIAGLSSDVTVDASEFYGNYITAAEETDMAASWSGGAELSAQQFPILFEYRGAGICVEEGSQLEVSQTDFELNGAPWGGSVYVDRYSAALLEKTMHTANFALFGSAVGQGDFPFYLQEGDSSAQIEIPQETSPEVTIDQSVFSGNESMECAIISLEASMTIQNSLFYDNMDEWATVGVVGMFDPFAEAQLEMPTHTVVNCTFADNLTGLASIYGEWAMLGVGNTICWDNVYEEPDMALESSAFEAQEMPELADVVGAYVAYSDLEYGYAQDGPVVNVEPGEGIISENPLFAWPAEGDYSLTAGSPCIDTGNGLEGFAPGYDLVGTSRPLDGDNDDDAEFDMGAFEYEYAGVVRLGGADRYETSVMATKEHFDSSDVVVIARGDVFADGLASAGLCGVYDAPLLLTRPYALPGVVSDEIERLGASTAYIMGGTGAVSADVAKELEDMGLEVERIGGIDRYATAALIAQQIESEIGTPTATFIARGDLFADALTVSPVAYGIEAPILLVRTDQLPEATVDVLEDLDPASVVIAGGSGAVSHDVEIDIKAVIAAADRVSGDDRYETSVAFSEFAVDTGWAMWDVVGLATGLAFPDALTGGPAVGTEHGVLLLTPGDTLHASVKATLEDHAENIGRVDIFGGTGAISESVMTAAKAAIE